jgi:FixJ family two-component response regulator
MAAFVGPRPPGAHVAHYDGNRRNNALSNLRYASPQENEADKRRHGTVACGERNANHKLTAAEVRWARRELAAGRTRQSVADDLGVSHGTIKDLKRGRTWAHLDGGDRAEAIALVKAGGAGL